MYFLIAVSHRLYHLYLIFGYCIITLVVSIILCQYQFAQFTIWTLYIVWTLCTCSAIVIAFLLKATWLDLTWVQSRFAETRFAETGFSKTRFAETRFAEMLTLTLNPNFGESGFGESGRHQLTHIFLKISFFRGTCPLSCSAKRNKNLP